MALSLAIYTWYNEDKLMCHNDISYEHLWGINLDDFTADKIDIIFIHKRYSELHHYCLKMSYRSLSIKNFLLQLWGTIYVQLHHMGQPWSVLVARWMEGVTYIYFIWLTIGRIVRQLRIPLAEIKKTLSMDFTVCICESQPTENDLHIS